MIFDRALVPSGDENHVADPRGHGLLDRVLDERLVDDGHHLLRARLGRRKEAAAHAGHGENGLRHFFHALASLNIFRRPASSTMAMPSSRALSSLLPASSPA